MPRELMALAPRTPVLREYEEEPLQPGDIRVRTRYGAVKHGTELRLYRNDGAMNEPYYDEEQRIFLPQQEPRSLFPIRLGNSALGTVIDVGPGVAGVAVGDSVVGYGRLRETHRWAWPAAGPARGFYRAPEGMDWRAAMCLNPGTVALAGVRDGHVRVGDRVAVFGLGAIGLLTVQLAKIAGAAQVIAFDPIPLRRAVAARTGADSAFDPSEVDAGLEMRRATGGLGADVAIETSASASALHHAIRGTAHGGTVAVTAWYKEFHGGLDLGREAIFNIPKLVFTRPESEPHQDYPRWDIRRLDDTVWSLLTAGRLACDEIIQPIVSFERVAEAYREIDEHPERSIKLGVTFGEAEGGSREAEEERRRPDGMEDHGMQCPRQGTPRPLSSRLPPPLPSAIRLREGEDHAPHRVSHRRVQ